MRLIRFDEGGRARWGRVEGEELIPLGGAPWETGGAQPAGASRPRREAKLLPPVAPSKILGIGRNYRAHAKELGNEVPKEPLVFLKAPSSLVPHHGTVILPTGSERVDFEGELAVVIGKRARGIRKDAWRDVVLGLTVAIDVTARDWQKSDGQWWRAKGSDTFCPLGPAIETEADPANLLLETLVNGVVKQSARTSDMAFDVGTLLEWITASVTLEPGDVILTGTPEGVARLAPGQTVEVRIEKVGSLVVSVATAERTAGR
jgi:2-keto-4-pentenoate hydratase/2-oxohepta-3-ene-1,7-dioic acid hydratase in catechol pathway